MWTVGVTDDVTGVTDGVTDWVGVTDGVTDWVGVTDGVGNSLVNPHPVH